MKRNAYSPKGICNYAQLMAFMNYFFSVCWKNLRKSSFPINFNNLFRESAKRQAKLNEGVPLQTKTSWFQKC